MLCLKQAAEDSIRNCHFAFGDQVFHQIIGIPMGSDTFIFLNFYERQYINYIKKESSMSARKFHHIFRCIDDLNYHQ